MPGQIDRRRVLTRVAAGGVTAALGPGAIEAAAAAYPLIRRRDRLFVGAAVNGVKTEALLDSAAESSLVSPAFAARLGLGGGAEVAAHGSGAATLKARLVEHVHIEAAGMRVGDATIAVIDLEDISRRLVGRPIDMVLGREIFDAGRLMIDMRAETIRPLAQREAPRGWALPLSEQFGIEALPVTIEDHAPTQAAFDLGNGTGVIVARRYADAIGLLQHRATRAVTGGGLGGARLRIGVVLKSLSLAGRRFTDVQAFIDDAPHSSDVNVGVGLLQNFLIETDFPDHTVWLSSFR